MQRPSAGLSDFLFLHVALDTQIAKETYAARIRALVRDKRTSILACAKSAARILNANNMRDLRCAAKAYQTLKRTSYQEK
jgi:hypothetical protein